jgi:hypothetical protein
MIKKLIIAIALTYLSNVVNAQIKFINKDWERCKVPIIELNTSYGIKQFIVDTGSSYSFIDSVFASKYCVFYKHVSINYQSIEYNVISNTCIYKVSINNVLFPMIAANMKELKTTVLPYNIIGVVGIDFITSHKLLLDFNKREIQYNK